MHNKGHKLGGWEKLDSVDPSSYSNFLQFMQKEKVLDSPFEILKVEKQVVYGWNYKFTLKKGN